MNIYKRAAMIDLTFTSSMGELSIMDLFKLPITTARTSTRVCLNTIGTNLKEEIQKGKLALIEDKRKTLDKLRLVIVKDVIETRLQAIKNTNEEIKIGERKTLLLEALAAKRQDELLQMSEKDILKELESL